MKIKGLKFPGKKNPPVNKPVRKKRRLKYIAVLPSFITLINAVCGFISLLLASRNPDMRWDLHIIRHSSMSPFALAGFMIFLAMLADTLDGRIARLTRTTSSFGGQLDSLADAISFGVAPAFLMVKLVEYHLAYLNTEMSSLFGILGRGIIFLAIFYAMCTVIRLARFNVENVEDEAAHMSFTGLPAPAAAGVVASLAVFHQQIMPAFTGEDGGIFHLFNVLTVSVLPAVTFLAGILMVSRIRYPHVPNQFLRGKKSLPVFIALFTAVLFSIWNIQLVFVVCFCGFALFGVIRAVITGLLRKKEVST